MQHRYEQLARSHYLQMISKRCVRKWKVQIVAAQKRQSRIFNVRKRHAVRRWLIWANRSARQNEARRTVLQMARRHEARKVWTIWAARYNDICQEHMAVAFDTNKCLGASFRSWCEAKAELQWYIEASNREAATPVGPPPRLHTTPVLR